MKKRAAPQSAADARDEIRELIYRYADRLDAGDFEGFAALFERGSLRVEGSDVPPAQGREAVLAMTSSMLKLYDGTPRTRHINTNTIVDLDGSGDTARARTYFTVIQALDDFPLQPVVAGRYLDRLVRDGDGRWRFEERVLAIDFMGDTSRHMVGSL